MSAIIFLKEERSLPEDVLLQHQKVKLLVLWNRKEVDYDNVFCYQWSNIMDNSDI